MVELVFFVESQFAKKEADISVFTSFIPAFCLEVFTYWRRKTTNLKFLPNFLHLKHMRLRGVGMALKWVDSLT